MISGVISQGVALPRGALVSSGAYFDLESIASPKVLGADSQAASSGLHTDADGFFTTRFARALVPAFKFDDGSIFAPKLVQAQVLQPALYVAVDVIGLPAVALPGILQTHLHAVDDAVFAPAVLTHGSLRPSVLNAFDAIYAPTLVAAQTLLPNRHTDSDIFYVPTRRTTVVPSRVVDGDIVYSSSAARLLGAGLVTDVDAFFAPQISLPSTTVSFDAATAVNVTLSGGNLVVTNTGTGTGQGIRVADASGKTTGKYYFEVTLTSLVGGGSTGSGIGTTTSTMAGMSNNATTGVELFFLGSGQIWTVGSVPASLGLRATGNVIQYAIDLDNRKFWCRVAPSGNWNGSGTDNPATNAGGITIPAGTIVPFCTFSSVANNVLTANFGASTFTGTVPSGFTSGWPI